MHILQIAGNQNGSDFVTTDPHADLKTFQMLVEQYLSGEKNQNNRLTVCGDLVDRGPDSLGIIRYVKEQNANGQRIYAVRGNHEDMVLNILNFIEVFEALDQGADDRSKIFIGKAPKLFALESLEGDFSKALLSEGQKLLQLAARFSYGGKVGGKDYFESFGKTLLNSFHPRFGDRAKAIRRLFADCMSAVGNGGGWVLKLSSEERTEVQNFIVSLPYIIRVGEVVREDGLLIAAFDVVHACPLSEAEMCEILLMPEPTLTDKQIEYITWARPASLCGQADIKMVLDDRAVNSPRVYVGHNVLSAYRSAYRNKNIFNLDADTYGNGCMFIVDHTNTTVAVEPSALLMSSFPDYPSVFSTLWALRDMLQPNAVTVEQKYNDICLYALVACNESISVKMALESQAYHLPERIINSGYDVRSFKDAFLNAVEFMVERLSPQLCGALSNFLLQQNKHPLARELSDFKQERYSHQTKSMAKAVSLLVNRCVAVNDSQVVVKKSCFSTRVVFLPMPQETTVSNKNAYSFSRYQKFF